MTPTMLLITTLWSGKKSFRLMPVSNDCPFSEGIYDPDSKVLVMMSGLKKEGFHMVARLDDNGDPIATKQARINGKKYKEQRVTLETFAEHYITEKREIEDFIRMIALNEGTFDYKTLMVDPALIVPEQPKIELIKP